jgi:hypothetical protein
MRVQSYTDVHDVTNAPTRTISLSLWFIFASI